MIQFLSLSCSWPFGGDKPCVFMVKGAVSKEVREALSVEGRVLQCIYLSSKMSYYLHVVIHISFVYVIYGGHVAIMAALASSL